MLNRGYYEDNFSFLPELALFFSVLFDKEYFFGNGALDFFETELLFTGFGKIFEKYERCLGLFAGIKPSKLDILA